jgi:ABC-type phosphate/phosphonate transport system substrate-binding protein
VTKPITMGAVLYDPKVSIIWDIIRDFFDANRVPMDVVFFTNYERQVEALVAGMLDMAWNSPLAWLETQHASEGGYEAIAMRDTDRDRRSHVVVRRDSGIASLADLRGKTVAMGAADSPQATLIPTEFLRGNGLAAGEDYQVQRFDVLVGKHGDHVGGERDAFGHLAGGRAAASTMLDLNWQTWTGDGTIDAGEFVTLATTPAFDHCVFAVRKDFPTDRRAAWLEALFSMSYDDPKHREMMDLEGLKAWLPGRTSGFGLLSSAVEQSRFFDRVGIGAGRA